MNLKNAYRLENGRCATARETVERLEWGLGRICRYRYEERHLSDSLYWGILSVEGLGFLPMGKGASSMDCKAATLAEAAEWLALRRFRTMGDPVDARQDEVHGALHIEDLISHVASATPDISEKIKDLPAAKRWFDGYSLASDRKLKVPLHYVQGISGANGTAAGNCIEEAVAHATHEVFERRASITVVRNRMVVPTIDRDSIDNPVLRSQMEYLESAGVEIIIKDLSFGGELPCVGVYFEDQRFSEDLQARRVFKAAASSDRAAALMSCLTEFTQLDRFDDSGRCGADGEPWPYESLLACQSSDNYLPLFFFGYIPYRNTGFLREGAKIGFDAGPLCIDCLEDIRYAKEICDKLGKDYVVVDLTDPAVGFPVVQVVIPGYSDILPYHPASSRVLFKGWTRDQEIGECQRPDGTRESVSIGGLFPRW